MAQNLTTRYSPLIQQRFKAQSFTDKYTGKDYDFDGAQSIVVYSVDKVTLNTYNRTGTSNRFGTINEMTDTKQTLTMSQDKSFTFAIDHGVNADQLNIKNVNDQLQSNWDEVVTPTIDQYRFLQWVSGAGLGAVGSALDKNTVMTAVLTGSAAMNNLLVPKKNRAIFIAESVYILCKVSTEIQNVPNLAGQALSRGVVGTLDGMDVVPVPDSYLPAGVSFIIKYAKSTVDPMKLKVLRVQKSPIGFDADIGECRFYHDSFVLDNKINGLFVYGVSGTAAMLPAPTLTNSSNTVTAACTGSTSIKYTTDGSNPKTSATASTYSAGVEIAAGQMFRAVGVASGKYITPVAQTMGV